MNICVALALECQGLDLIIQDFISFHIEVKIWILGLPLSASSSSHQLFQLPPVRNSYQLFQGCFVHTSQGLMPRS